MNKLRLLKIKISHRVRWYLGNIRLCFWFIARAWDAIRNKIIIINADIVESNGGFKYYQINISKRPLDKKADYSKW